MSVRYSLHVLDPKLLAAFEAHPDLVEDWLGGDDYGIDPDGFREHVQEQGIEDDLGEVRSIDDGVSLDRWLPAIAFILGKLGSKAQPLCALADPRLRSFLGPSGSRYALDPAQVVELSGLLEGIELVDFLAGYDAAELTRAEVYPDLWNEAGSRDEVVNAFEVLRNAVSEAVEEGAALLIAVS